MRVHGEVVAVKRVKCNEFYEAGLFLLNVTHVLNWVLQSIFVHLASRLGWLDLWQMDVFYPLLCLILESLLQLETNQRFVDVLDIFCDEVTLAEDVMLAEEGSQLLRALVGVLLCCLHLLGTVHTVLTDTTHTNTCIFCLSFDKFHHFLTALF